MTDALALWLGERLLVGSIQVAGLVAAVWLVCRLVPRVPAAAQAALWWLVALKLVLVFAPVPAIQLPVLPATFERQTQLPSATALVAGDHAPASSSNAPLQALILIWVAALLAQAGRLALDHRHLKGVVRRSVPWTNAGTIELATRIGLTRAPQVRLSDEIDGPQVYGLWSPIVLMPPDTVSALSDEERTMTLCHELMHIRRRDLALGWVPACAERLFFFHPLARLSARHYVTAREAACDAAAMRALGVAPAEYGRLLIRLGIGNVRPAIAAGGAPFSNSSLKRRLHMLEHHQPSKSSRRWWWVVALVAAVVIPMQLVARTPAAPQAISKPSIDLYQFVSGAWEKAQGKQVYVMEPDSQKLKRLQARDARQEAEQVKVLVEKLKIEKVTQDMEVEMQKQEKLLEKELLARKLLARAQGEKELRGRELLAEKDEKALRLRKLLAEAADAQSNEKKEYFLQKRLQEATAEQKDRDLRDLAERLERLAAEQQKLANEIRALQRESSR